MTPLFLFQFLLSPTELIFVNGKTSGIRFLKVRNKKQNKE